MYKDTGPLSSTNTLQEKREGRKEGEGKKEEEEKPIN